MTQDAPFAWNTTCRELLQHNWVVSPKPPRGGPAQVIDYLARYTHRVAISNERIIDSDHEQPSG